MRKCLAASLPLLFLVPAIYSADPPKSPSDWPQWRGPQRDAICTETGLLKQWPSDGPKLLWDSGKVNAGKSVGIGFSSLAITQDKIFTMGDLVTEEKVDVQKNGKTTKKIVRKGDEFVFCLDANTGKELWKTKLGVNANYGGYPGPRSIPTVDGERLYVISPHGELFCLKSATGSILWRKDFKKDFGGEMMSGWGYSESPTIDGDKLICTPGGKNAGLVALNKTTGAVIWKCQLPVNCGAGYSSIVKSEASGVKQYVTIMGPELGAVGVDAKSGRFLWSYERVANDTANIPTAIVRGDRVFASTGYGTGAALLQLLPDGKGGIKVKEEYFKNGNSLQNHHGGVIMLGDYIYGGHGHNKGLPFCLEWKTGKFAWGPERGPGAGSAGVLYADGHLYFRYQSGEMALVEANPGSYLLKSSFHVPIAGNGWPHPVIYHGKLYVRGDNQILCYDIKQ